MRNSEVYRQIIVAGLTKILAEGIFTHHAGDILRFFEKAKSLIESGQSLDSALRDSGLLHHLDFDNVIVLRGHDFSGQSDFGQATRKIEDEELSEYITIVGNALLCDYPLCVGSVDIFETRIGKMLISTHAEVNFEPDSKKLILLTV